jgi:phospholipase/carboxylesterase
MSQTEPELLPAVEIEPDGPARHSVIWLHGLGADGHDFPPIVAELGVAPKHAVRWIFPHAPSIPVTVNGGMVMPAWYDIRGVDFDRRHDETGIRLSTRRVEDLIARENERGVPTERICLAGFSQGGAIALFTALKHPERLLGIVALSTYLVLEEAVRSERHQANLETPIFQAHGTHDPMVTTDRGQRSYETLVEMGYAVEWHDYPMMHQVCSEEIETLGSWLEDCFESS